ncbi:universal stress protein [Kineosporia sp. J2-2]|uniref:Universal stress protein n=1 Tax=Kineosporia corallincola TaxID=2835133 RepID=A0ABS5TRF5_9ACTN|nr:universal stress protein [Kineosporia corallincola]MBT0773385.1 universal stress protein [Kineosporia corallincola]
MTIVLGYDESRPARAALETAITMARRLGEDLVFVYGAGVPGGASEEMAAQRDAIEELGRAALAGAVSRAEEAGVGFTVELSGAKPVEALLGVAERYGATMIVVGSNGESPVRAAMLGAIPHKLLQATDRPVLCVPAAS